MIRHLADCFAPRAGTVAAVDFDDVGMQAFIPWQRIISSPSR